MRVTWRSVSISSWHARLTRTRLTKSVNVLPVARRKKREKRLGEIARDEVDDGIDLLQSGIVVPALHLDVREQSVVGAAREVGEKVAERREARQPARMLDAQPVLAAALRHAEELDPVARALEERHGFGELRNDRRRLLDRLVPELDHEVALGDATFGEVEGDPVVRQA